MNSKHWPIDLADSVSTGICVLDKEFTVELWNQYMETYTGIDREDIEGRPIWDFYPAFREDRYRDRIRLLFDGWPPLFFSSRLNNLFQHIGEGEEKRKYQDVSVISIPEDNCEHCNVLITVVDETDLNLKLEESNQLYKSAREEVERRQIAEAELRESETRLKQLNKTKDKLMSIIAHDLRSPVASNMSGLEVLVGTYDDTPDESRKDLLELMLDSTKQTYRLLEDLLTWSRTQAEEGVAFRTPFLIKQTLDYEAEKMSHVVRDKGIELHLEDMEEGMVEADRNMVQAVLRNLLSNAVKFTHEGGHIYIASELNGKEVRVSVRDTGVGMEPRRIRELFELNRLESTPGTQQEKGTGFGLLICKEFLEKNGGELHVESTPGKGSSFTFSLPLYGKNAS